MTLLRCGVVYSYIVGRLGGGLALGSLLQLWCFALEFCPIYHFVVSLEGEEWRGF